MKKLIAILAVFIFVGVGAYMLYCEWDMGRRCTAETLGTVEKVERKREAGRNAYYVMIGYEAAGGKYSFETSVSSSKLSLGPISFSKTSYKKGDELALLYDPEKPNDVVIKGSHKNLLGGILFSAAGLLVLIMVLRGKIDA